MNHIRLLLSGLMVFCLPAVSVIAQTDTIISPEPTAAMETILANDPPITGSEVTELLLFTEDELVITATKSALKVAEAPASVTVITAEQIKKMGYRTLTDVLSTIADVYITPSEKHHSQIFIRGIPVYGYNDKILLMVDGIPHREIFYGNMQLDQYLPMENIKRVEIIKGPGSALYGTNAFSGVINVITQQFGEVEEVNVSGIVGTGNTTGFSANIGKQYGPLKLLLFGRHYETDGDGPEFSNKYVRSVMQHDPAVNNTIWLKAQAYGVDLDAKVIEYEHKYIVDPDLPRSIWDASTYDYKDGFLALGYKRDLFEKAKISGQLIWQQYDLNNFWQLKEKVVDTIPSLSGADTTFYPYEAPRYDIWALKKTQIKGGQGQLEWQLPYKYNIIIGAEAFEEEIVDVRDLYIERATGDTVAPGADTTQSPYNYWCPKMKKTSYAGFFESIWQGFDWLNVTLGLRRDYNESYKQVTYSPRVGAVIAPIDKLSLKLLYGEAFRAPSYRELYTKQSGTLWTLGNPDLKPEKIKTSEIGAEWEPHKCLRSRLTCFYSELKDLITLYTGATSKSYINLDTKMITSGMDLLVKFSHMDFVGSANYSYVSPREAGARIPYVPMHSAVYGLEYRPKPGLSLSTQALWIGKRIRAGDDINKRGFDPRYPIMENRPELDDNLTINISALLEHKNWEASITVNNLFNAKQYDSNYRFINYFDWERPGRSLWLKLSYAF